MSESVRPSTGESDGSPVIYFDHAATSWPKPKPVVDAVARALTEIGGNPGRGGHRLALASMREVYTARRACAGILGVPDPKDLIFVSGCTTGCNMMLKGTLSPGDRVVVGSMEHNAVVRPLEVLRSAGVEVSVVRADATGVIDPDEVRNALRGRSTRAVVCQHASNVSGTIQPIPLIAEAAHEAGAVLLVDGAQAAGHLDVDVSTLHVDAYAVSGHKGLLGPQGIGLLYLEPQLEVDEILEGGTGGQSESPGMPTERPDRYEAGTPNTPGIMGLGAAALFLAEEARALRLRETNLVNRLHEGILAMGGYRVLGPEPGVPRVPLVSVVPHAMTPAQLAAILDREYGIACRAGLHCAPWAHEMLGSLETGACRFGVGYGTSDEDVSVLLTALEDLAR